MMNLILATTPTAPDVNFQMLLPELILSTAGVVVMLVDAFTGRSQRREAAAGAEKPGHTICTETAPRKRVSGPLPAFD